MLIIENKIKEKEIEKEINIDLAIVASQWFKVANYNRSAEKTKGKQPLCQTRKVYVEDKESAIFRSSNGERKG